MADERLWRCEICGYMHQGAAPPGRCPVCFAGPEAFTAASQELPAPAPAGPPGRIVIVGGGAAGLAAAEAARGHDPAAELVVLAGEGTPPYWRLELTRYLAGEIRAERLPLRPPAWYTDQRIELRFLEAVGLDRAGRRVLLRDGTALAYDRLILATGAHPYVPPIPGLHDPRVLCLRSRADAEALLRAARPGARILCLGGGLLGLESAAALARRGGRVQVLERAPTLLPRQLAREGARLLVEHLAALGVQSRTGVELREVAGHARGLALRLGDGALLEADVLLVAVGITPETFLAREAGLEVDRGIRVGDSMATSDPAIFACGDAAEHRGVLYGLWEAAQAMGTVAGARAAGAEASFAARPLPALLKVVGLDLFSCGCFDPPGPGVRDAAPPGSWQRLVWRQGRLAGANLVGDARAAGILAEAVAGAWDPGRLAAAAPPGLEPNVFPDPPW